MLHWKHGKAFYDHSGEFLGGLFAFCAVSLCNNHPCIRRRAFYRRWTHTLATFLDGVLHICTHPFSNITLQYIPHTMTHTHDGTLWYCSDAICWHLKGRWGETMAHNKPSRAWTYGPTNHSLDSFQNRGVLQCAGIHDIQCSPSNQPARRGQYNKLRRLSGFLGFPSNWVIVPSEDPSSLHQLVESQYFAPRTNILPDSQCLRRTNIIGRHRCVSITFHTMMRGQSMFTL